MISWTTIWDNALSLEGSFEPKMMRIDTKWARYGHFTLGRLSDFSRDHLGHCCILRGSLWVSLGIYYPFSYPFSKEKLMENPGTLQI